MEFKSAVHAQSGHVNYVIQSSHSGNFHWNDYIFHKNEVEAEHIVRTLRDAELRLPRTVRRSYQLVKRRSTDEIVHI
jgi:DNA polymerase III delta subunit